MAFAIVLFVFVPTLISSTYYAQTQGVCLKAGRVLKKEELRKAVLTNVVNYYTRSAFQANWKEGYDFFWTGINSPAKEINILKLVDDSYNNGKSIEENFGLNVLLKGRNNGKYKNISINELLEPFIFVYYDIRKKGDALVFISDDLQEVSFDALDDARKKAALKKMDFYNKLTGYGNHFFNFYSPAGGYSLLRACCDNRDQNEEDYFKMKQDFYHLNLHYITGSSHYKNSIKSVITISNCGDVLLSKRDDISILGSVYEEEDWEHP